MGRTEQEFLTTLETYVSITIDRLADGRTDASEELDVLLKMVRQRRAELEGCAAWLIKQDKEKDNGWSDRVYESMA